MRFLGLGKICIKLILNNFEYLRIFPDLALVEDCTKLIRIMRGPGVSRLDDGGISHFEYKPNDAKSLHRSEKLCT